MNFTHFAFHGDDDEKEEELKRVAFLVDWL